MNVLQNGEPMSPAQQLMDIKEQRTDSREDCDGKFYLIVVLMVQYLIGLILLFTEYGLILRD